MRPLLAAFRVQARYWAQHRVQAALCFVGIVLGVAVFSAIDLANRGALRAYADGIAAIAGRATHRVFRPDGGQLPERLYLRLASAPGVAAATPLLNGRARVLLEPPVPVSVLGLDPLSDGALREFRFLASEDDRPDASDAPADTAVAPLERFLADPAAVAMPRALAERLGVTQGAELEVATTTGRHRWHVVALFDPPAGQAAAFSRTVVQDVAAHQEQFGKLGGLDAVNLLLHEPAADAEAALRAGLPPSVELERIGAGAERVERMSRAFQLNLEAVGLFALLVAMFLIYNAASFSVAQRERVLATLRCLGAQRGTLFPALLVEALLAGLVGGALGVAAGRWLGALMLQNVGATLFEVVLHLDAQPASVGLDAGVWMKGLGLGAGVSLAGALFPAWGGARVSPLAAIQGGRQSAHGGVPMWAWALAALVSLLAAAVLLALPGRSLPAGLVGATAIAVGMAALCPPVAALVSRVLAAPIGRIAGAPARMAARNLGRSLSRTGVAAASLMIALALALAIEITVRSFKASFQLWLDQAVTADVYLEPSFDRRAGLSDAMLDELRALPMVEDIAAADARAITFGDRRVLVFAVELPAFAQHATIPPIGISPEAAYARLAAGDAFMSETLAYPLGIAAGDRVDLPTAAGPRSFRIGAIVHNYAVPQGVIYLSLATYQATFGRAPPGQAALWLRPGTDAEQALRTLETHPALADFRLIPNAALRVEALRTIDRTFAITDVMATLASFIAFMAVVSALTALLEDRMRTLGYLRAIGVSRRQLAASLTLEAALLATVAAVVGWAAGVLMAWVTVFVVNRRAFGWTLQFLPAEGSYGRLLTLALVAALLGSVYPIWRATRQSVTATIREE